MMVGFAPKSPFRLTPMYLVFSTSLNRDSRSRILAQYAVRELESRGEKVVYFDLVDQTLPPCDAGECYHDPNVLKASELIESARGILVAAPVYNYDLGSSTKGLIELTGKAWTDKVVGFLCAAGGAGSFMAPMQLANSLMLDFRSLVLPRFVYATGDQFQGDEISERQVEERIDRLVDQLVTVATALQPESSSSSP